MQVRDLARLRGELTAHILFSVRTAVEAVGHNNVIVTPLIEQKEEKVKDEGTKEPKKFSPGLTERDARAIVSVLPNVNTASGEVVYQTLITREGRRRSGKVVGVDTTYFDLLNLTAADGNSFAPI